MVEIDKTITLYHDKAGVVSVVSCRGSAEAEWDKKQCMVKVKVFRTTGGRGVDFPI